MILFIVAVVSSLAIVALGLVQGRRCFGAYDRTTLQVYEFSKVLKSCAEGISFKEVLGGWSKSEDATIAYVARSMLRFFGKQPLQLQGRLGWVVDLEMLCDPRRNFRAHPGFGKSEVMPGVLTGIGILFTFLGLSAGIFGLDPTNAEQLTSGVSRLLSGMSLAFLTSIAGLGTSLWWTWRNKLCNAAFEAAFAELSLMLHSKPFLLVPEEMNYQLLDFQATQTQALTNLGETIYQATTRAFNEAGLQEIKKMLARVGDNRGVNEILDLLRNELTNLNRSAVENAEINRKLNRAVNLLVQSQTEGRPAVGAGATGLLSGNPEEVVANLARINQAQSQTTNSIQEASLELHKMLKTARVASADIAKVHRHVKEHLDQLDAHWKAYQQHLQGMQSSLERTLVSFGDGMKNSLVQVHGQIDGLLAQSLNHFSGTLENLEGTVNGLALLLQKEAGDQNGSAKGWLGRLNR